MQFDTQLICVAALGIRTSPPSIVVTSQKDLLSNLRFSECDLWKCLVFVSKSLVEHSRKGHFCLSVHVEKPARACTREHPSCLKLKNKQTKPRFEAHVLVNNHVDTERTTLEYRAGGLFSHAACAERKISICFLNNLLASSLQHCFYADRLLFSRLHGRRVLSRGPQG